MERRSGELHGLGKSIPEVVQRLEAKDECFVPSSRREIEYLISNSEWMRKEVPRTEDERHLERVSQQWEN